MSGKLGITIEEDNISVSGVDVGKHVSLVTYDPRKNDDIEHYVVLVDELGNPRLYIGKGGEVYERPLLTERKWVQTRDNPYFPGKGFVTLYPPLCVGFEYGDEVVRAIMANRSDLPREHFSPAVANVVDVLQPDGSYKQMGLPASDILLVKGECLFRPETKGLRFLYLRTSEDGKRQDAYVERTYSQDAFPLDILFSDVKLGGTYTANLSRREITSGKL